MNKLEMAVEQVLKEIKPQHTARTFKARKGTLHRLLRFARKNNYEEPCQELYDAFTADDKGSRDVRFALNHAVRLVDKVAGTMAKDRNGRRYNEPPLPTVAETTAYFQDRVFSVSPDAEISYLIVRSEEILRSYNLSASTIGQYRHAWLEIRQYCLDHGSKAYQQGMLLQYIQEITKAYENGNTKYWKWKIRRKAATVLIEVAETGSFCWKSLPYHDLSCGDAKLDEIRDHFVCTLQQRNLEPSYISLCEYVFRYSLKYADIQAYEPLTKLNIEAISQIRKEFSKNCNKNSLTTIIPILRTVLQYLYAEKIIEQDYSGAIMTPFSQTTHLRSYIPMEEDEKLQQALEMEPVRNRAILLLALKLGLREVDICCLKLSDIDWRHDCIHITQEKTGTALCLPLLPDVGNALMEYILNERPKTEDRCPYVFLRRQAPYRRLKGAYHICSSFLSRHNIQIINEQQRGLHLFRHTLTHRLLAARVPHPIITDVLGHTSKESNKPYLSMEEDMLRMCALDLSLVGGPDYE